jgi:hypothetical protein
MLCTSCPTTKETKPTKAGNDRLPKGWHRLADETLCADCWAKRYILRAVTFPINGPVGRDWKELRAALASCWADSTGLANWCMTELAKSDVTRIPTDEKMPPMPRVYLYPEARRRFPSMSPTSLNAIIHAAESRYRKARLSVIWRSEASLPRYRYPCPYPAHNQAWHAEYGPDNTPMISVSLAGERWLLRLRGGAQMRRQLKSFAHIVAGRAVQGELALYRVRANFNDHREGQAESSNGAGPKVYYRVMAKLVAWLPRQEAKPLSGTMKVETGTDHFWLIDGEPWLCGDYLRRWCEQHRRFLDRIGLDLKFEKRFPWRSRAQMNAHREQVCAKFRNRINTFIDQATAMLAGKAWRNKIASVKYDGANKGYLEQFPWFQLEGKLKTKLDAFGIEFKAARGTVLNSDSQENDAQANGVQDVGSESAQ